MANSHLRLYCGPDGISEEVATTSAQSPQVTVNLADVLGPLRDAIKNQRMWLQDFECEKVTISSDLYEVILAYEHYCRSSA